jgi:small subunit ribosomal protein S6
MRRYEMMLIVTDTLEEEAATEVFDKAKDILAQQGGTLLDEAWWGRRRLAYEIDKRHFGFYGVLDFEATSEAVDELERRLKITDEVVRFKTVRPEVRVRKSA